MEIHQLLEKAIDALDAEIEAVREKPSRDTLFDGEKKKHAVSDGYHYEFKTHNPSIRYAEEIRAELRGEEFEIHPVELVEDHITLLFPDDYGDTIGRIDLEWENDFVLRKMREEIYRIADRGDEDFRRIKSLFQPDSDLLASQNAYVEVWEDGQRNEAQREAIRKSQQNSVLYVWGPPGTGKTSTLGYIMANYLLSNKKVLFASNTNRAVDIGLLSVVEALETMDNDNKRSQVVRFGEPALEHRLLEDRLFSNIVEKKKQKRKEEASRWLERLEEWRKLKDTLDEEEVETGTSDLEMRRELLESKIEGEGGEEAVEQKVETLQRVNERVELGRKDLVATTLAKVCTSELFDDMDFEAVVVDEASMANLPYLMVLAHKASAHIVVVGDPMQLPPIAVTNDKKAKEFLEYDIFGWVSNAQTTEDLFQWHDQNRPLTCFFDVQYRLKEDLAQIISSVFYEGRLHTASDPEQPVGSKNKKLDSVALADTSRYDPYLVKKSGKRGFKPRNEVHLFLIKRIVRQKVMKEAVPMREIGVIVPFRSAVYDAREILYGEGFREVEVGTIHTFQGREKKVIIFDTVMSGELAGNQKRHYTVRPFDEEKNGLNVPRLLNVAFSRSKSQLIIIADMEHVKRMYEGKFLGQLLHQIKEKGSNLLHSKSPIS